MKICPSCQESNHDAADLCLLCGARLPVLPVQSETVVADGDPQILLPVGPAEPPRGALAIALYHDTEDRVLHYHVIESDTTLIGREDAARSVYPDLDLSRFVTDGVAAERVSRQHARLIRRGRRLELEVIEGSTGTQVNREIVAAGTRVTVEVGTRIVLGARVRTKLVQF